MFILKKNKLALKSWTYGIRTVGTILAMLCSTLLLIYLQARYIIGLNSIFALLAGISAFLILEDNYIDAPIDNDEVENTSRFACRSIISIKKNSFSSCCTKIRNCNYKSIMAYIVPALFLFTYNAVPNSADAYYFYLSETYPNYAYSLFGLWGQFGSLLGTYIYYKKLRKMVYIFDFVLTFFLNITSNLSLSP